MVGYSKAEEIGFGIPLWGLFLHTLYVCLCFLIFQSDNPDFHVDKQVAAAPGSNAGTEVAVEVSFEPSKIGESRGTLTVTSATGGDYTFPLFGTATAPKPQGPFIVKAGSTTNITFRNVFPHTTPFTFQVRSIFNELKFLLGTMQSLLSLILHRPHTEWILKKI